MQKRRTFPRARRAASELERSGSRAEPAGTHVRSGRREEMKHPPASPEDGYSDSAQPASGRRRTARDEPKTTDLYDEGKPASRRSHLVIATSMMLPSRLLVVSSCLGPWGPLIAGQAAPMPKARYNIRCQNQACTRPPTKPANRATFGVAGTAGGAPPPPNPLVPRGPGAPSDREGHPHHAAPATRPSPNNRTHNGSTRLSAPDELRCYFK